MVEPPSPYTRLVAGNLYATMIQPIVPFTVRGAIWYQGEANRARGEEYHRLFPALIENWREDFDNEEMPFYFVQLPGFGRNRVGYRSMWAELREAQLWTWRHVEGTGMAVSIDVGEADNLHPIRKEAIGKRLALLARKYSYVKSDLVASGPVYKSFQVDGSDLILTFDSIGDGLELRPSDDASEFIISGKDNIFYKATAQIQDDKIILSSKSVTNPTAARYCWNDWVSPTVYNKNGLPASPFRTDPDYSF